MILIINFYIAIIEFGEVYSKFSESMYNYLFVIILTVRNIL